MAGQFMSRLEGLLSGSNPLGNFGLGLLSASGPSATPQSLGQVLAGGAQFASQREQEAMRNQMMREQISQQKRRSQAQQQLQGLLGGMGGDPQESELIGLLSQLAPDAMAQGVAQQMFGGGADRADPADLRMMDALGLPRTEEGFAKFQALKGDEGNKAAMDALNLQIQGLQLSNMKREQETADRVTRETRLTQQNSIERGLEQTQKIADLTLKLEGTALAAGLPASEWRRSGMGALSAVGGALGFDTEKLNADLTAFDTFKKNLNDQLITLMSAGSLGQGTDNKLQQYRNSLASPDVQPGAVMAIQAGIAETLLDQADVLGFELKNRAALEESVQRMKDYQPPGAETVVDVPGAVNATGRAVVRAADIGRMSLQQLEKVDTTGWSRELLEAAAKRWDELNAR